MTSALYIQPYKALYTGAQKHYKVPYEDVFCKLDYIFKWIW